MTSNTVIITVEQVLRSVTLDATFKGYWTVWFFGKSYETFLNIKRHLPENWSSADTGKVITDNAQFLSEDIANLESTQLSQGDDRTWWDASDLGDRGPFVTNLLEGAAQAKAVQDAIGEDCQNLFVVEDMALARMLYQSFVKNGFDLAWERPDRRMGTIEYARGWLDATRTVVIGALRTASGVRHLLRRIAINRSIRRDRPIEVNRLRECDLFLTIWPGEDVFPATGNIEYETYLGPLPKLFRDRGYKVGYFINSLITDGSIDEIMKNSLLSEDPVLSVEDCQTPWSIVKAAMLSLIDPWHLSINQFRGGVCLEGILRYERRREILTWRPVQSRVFKDVGKRMREFGLSPKAVIHNYENQPWEKLLRAGLRKYIPDCQVVGFQHVPLPPLFINTYPSEQEINDGQFPDHILVAGSRFVDLLQCWKIPMNRVSVGGALRFESVLKNLSDKFGSTDAGSHKPGSHKQGERVTLLCCSSIIYDDCLELICQIALAVKRLSHVDVIVNYHPALDAQSRKRIEEVVAVICGGDASHIEFSNEGSRSLLGRADIVIYNTSSSAFDALAHHCPVLCVMPENNIDYNRVPDSLCESRRSVDEIVKFLDTFVHKPKVKTSTSDFTQVLAPIDMDEICRVIERPGKA